MALGIAHTIFPLSVFLVSRLVQNHRARSSHPLVVSINVGHMNDNPSPGRPVFSGRHNMVRLACTVKPDAARARPDLTMNNRPVRHALKASRREPP